jgi:hypothetical protein
LGYRVQGKLERIGQWLKFGKLIYYHKAAVLAFLEGEPSMMSSLIFESQEKRFLGLFLG